MKFLADERLYSSTEYCLEMLRALERGANDRSAQPPERFHLYWYGPFGLKQAFTIKSFLATQDLGSSELWLWLDGERGYAGFEENPLLRPLLRFLRVKRFDPEAEARGTPVERKPDLYDVPPINRSNFVRHVVLYKYGGTYADFDVMFLRDMRLLQRLADFSAEFCYHWSAQPYANSAILRLREGSETARAMLDRSIERGDCNPKKVLQFDDNGRLDLLVLPCSFFDPLWLDYDGYERYEAVPFRRFEDFFHRFCWRSRLLPSSRSYRNFFGVRLRLKRIRSYRDFFRGAFTYHWHNCWDTPEHKDSYFGLFNQQFDAILRERLGVEVAPT